ncbi:complex I subunit 5 family protein [Kineobactrum salinum]|uniref:NADH-ubiquinone oxidoreductase n=1 Tax=Kineobactrum salinum TaxID=2708301 RepID=A0A6C0TZ11_9GAMM|nr:complex I subunit 5 family protein [Kineobactrum salinum]QIB65031.1 NADH-ubiquinone oxidoreductase [Kineobactrum salinum]
MTAPPLLLITASLLLPLLYPALAVPAGWHRALRIGLPLLPLPALLLCSGGHWQLELPWLLLGGQWALDELRCMFLLLTALLWGVAGLYAAAYMGSEQLRRFCVFWGLTLAGNLGLVLAADIASFYTFFSLMTVAAYGLVVHTGTERALRAGRVYLVMALVGEMVLLAGLLLAAETADSMLLHRIPEAVAQAPWRDLICGLLITGFGVKVGLPLLHFWLPLAHPVAPTPASAVLSGAMIKAGLLGWLLTLPLGVVALPDWSLLLLVAGFTASLGAAVIGVFQHDPKTVLAYSSISQMGLATLMVAAGLGDPGRQALLLSATALFALHHGLAKGALFLATGLSLPQRRPARVGLWLLIALPGLSLAGLPWTSGELAKAAVKGVLLADGPALPLAAAYPHLLTAATVATLALIARYLWLLRMQLAVGSTPVAQWAGWGLATALSLSLYGWLL